MTHLNETGRSEVLLAMPQMELGLRSVANTLKSHPSLEGINDLSVQSKIAREIMDPSQGAKLAEAFIANQERNGATANLHDPELRRSAANLLEAIDLVQEQLPSQDSSTNLNNLQKFVDTVTFRIKTTVKDLFHMVA